MNLLKIKQRFIQFMASFEQQDIELVIQYVKLALHIYDTNPTYFICKQIKTGTV